MKKGIILVVILIVVTIFFNSNVLAQNKKINLIWEKEYKLKEGINIGYDAISVKNGYLITGMSCYGYSEGTIFLLKINQEGNKLWSRIYDYEKNQMATSIIANKNKYIIGGVTSNDLLTNESTQSYLMISDDFGDKTCEKVIKNKYNTCVVDLEKTENDNFIVGGYLINEKKQFNHYLAKIDSSNNIIWQKNYLEEQNKFLKKITIDEDNILLGGILCIENKFTKAYLTKVDNNGKKLWEKYYGNKDLYSTKEIIVNKDCYIIGGDITWSGVFICKFNKNGDKIWSKDYCNENLRTITSINNLNKGYLLIGKNKNENIYVMEVDEQGNKLWKESLKSTKTKIPLNVLKISKRDYLIIGYNHLISKQQNLKSHIYLQKIKITL